MLKMNVDLMDQLQLEQFPQQSLADTLGSMIRHPSGITNSSAAMVMKQFYNTKALKTMSSIYHHVALRELAFWLEMRPKQLQAAAPGTLTLTQASFEAKLETWSCKPVWRKKTTRLKLWAKMKLLINQKGDRNKQKKTPFTTAEKEAQTFGEEIMFLPKEAFGIPR